MIAVRVATAMKPKRRENNNGSPTWWRPSAVLPSTQDMPVLRRQRAEDRLQGRQAAAALHFGARQDRAEPHHRGVGQEAARASPRDQAVALPRAVALRDPVI